MKKHKNEPKQSIYFDTNVIIGYFKKGDERKHSKGVIEKAATMIKNPDIMVKIPLISLGECAIWLLDHNPNGGLVADLRTLVKAKLKAKTPPPDKRSYKIAFELMEDDGHIEPTDALIVAQAIADHTSEWLITTDSVLLDNKTVFDKVDDAKSNLKISDRFTKRGAGKNVK
jgi:predicted nucleic acid-binding protein